MTTAQFIGGIVVSCGLIAVLLLVNFGGSLWAFVRRLFGKSTATASSDLGASPAALAYIQSITVIPATPEQRLKALEAGQSPAQFMRDLLGKGAKA